MWFDDFKNDLREPRILKAKGKELTRLELAVKDINFHNGHTGSVVLTTRHPSIRKSWH
jgi:hypothetical protein